MDLLQQLEQTFATNFQAYFRSHVAHVNITGRNFASDHQLLNTIYEDLQDQIDVIAEFLRANEGVMPRSIGDVLITGVLSDEPVEGESTELLATVYDDIETLISDYHELYAVAEEEAAIDVGNYAQDRIAQLKKFCWMLRSTIENS